MPDGSSMTVTMPHPRPRADRDVTVTSAGRDPARGYLYAKDDILYFAWTDYTSRHEFGELLRKLL